VGKGRSRDRKTKNHGKEGNIEKGNARGTEKSTDEEILMRGGGTIEKLMSRSKEISRPKIQSSKKIAMTKDKESGTSKRRIGRGRGNLWGGLVRELQVQALETKLYFSRGMGELNQKLGISRRGRQYFQKCIDFRSLVPDCGETSNAEEDGRWGRKRIEIFAGQKNEEEKI